MTTKAIKVLAISCATFQLAACSSDSGKPPSGNETQKPASTQSGQQCFVKVGNESLFIGEPRCLSRLPQKRMSGLWVVGLEHSVFYENATRLPPETYEDIWLEADVTKIFSSYGLQFDGNNRIFKIDFIGTKSEAPGVYGHAGSYERGAMVSRVISLEEVTGEIKQENSRTRQ